MSELVSRSEIEKKVGTSRHKTEHRGRARTDEQRVYILHSQKCLDSGIDLRECIYSKALDKGIDMAVWEAFLDRPMRLGIDVHDGDLFPVPLKDAEL